LTAFFLVLAADSSRIMQDQMSGAALAMPQDAKSAFKAEWEALQISAHKWALKDVDAELVGEVRAIENAAAM